MEAWRRNKGDRRETRDEKSEKKGKQKAEGRRQMTNDQMTQ
jgi:hypothetical protein